MRWACSYDMRSPVLLLTEEARRQKSASVLANDGCRIHCEIAGSGPTVVFALGNSAPLDSRIWDRQVAALSAHWQVVRYDERYTGRSGRVAGEYFAAADLEAVVSAVCPDRIVLVGLGEGGTCALEFVLTHPKMVERVVLVHPSVPGQRPPSDIASFFEEINAVFGLLVPAGKSYLATGDSNDLIDQSIKVLFRHPDSPDRQRFRSIVQDNIHVLCEQLKTSRRPARPRWLIPSVADQLTTISCPTLSVSGSHTSTALSRGPEALRLIPQLHEVVLSDAGFLVNVDQPDEFNRVLIEFLVAGEPVSGE